MIVVSCCMLAVMTLKRPERTLKRPWSLTGILSDWTAVPELNVVKVLHKMRQDNLAVLQNLRSKSPRDLLADREEKGPNRFYVLYRGWPNEPVAERVETYLLTERTVGQGMEVLGQGGRQAAQPRNCASLPA